MEQWFLSQFGGIDCELGVASSTGAGFVAWALRVGTDGRRAPLYDRQGALLVVRGVTPTEALTAVRRQAVDLFGPERLQHDEPHR